MTDGKRQMKLGLFVRPCGHHIAAWRHPRTQADAGVNFQHFIELAQTAERGLFDMLFSADTNSSFTAENEGLNRQHYVAWIEPFTLLSALSAFTKNIGLVCTASTSFEQPYAVARKFASLDHVSGGRAGWNVVTSGLEVEALNFSQDAHAPKAERYKRAREFTELVRALWDSWDEDAFTRNRETGIFFDPDKMHVLNHRGEHYQVQGPLNVARTPQGHPVVVQAGASETAEVVFGASRELAIAQAFYADLKGRMPRFGRDPDSLKILPGLIVTVAQSEAEARARHEAYQELIHPDVGVALLSTRMGHDLRGLPLDEPLPELPKNDVIGSRSDMMIALARRDNLTIRQLYKIFAASRGHASIIGSPKQVADMMEQWFSERGCDGFNILVPSFPHDFTAFVDLVVPELQRRGIYRTKYEGTTLRDSLGLATPVSRYATPQAAQ
jgi:N-acetyl-S-(2-succino)cysteine monooxygenase